MKIITRDEFLARKKELVEMLKDSIFIYPTDTIYGIGCNAENKDLVSRIRVLKNRLDAPFSVIAPSKEWIKDNCVIDDNANNWISKLPGPYTLILELKNKYVISKNVNLDGDTLGVRMPDNWFTSIVFEIGLPIITTSANISGHNFMTDLTNLDPDLKKDVDLFIDDGPIDCHPSTLVFLDKKEVFMKKR